MKRRKRRILLTLKTLANVANFVNVAKKAILEKHTVVFVGFAAVQMILIHDYVARQSGTESVFLHLP